MASGNGAAVGNERYDGKPINVGGVTYLIPPLSLGALKRLREPVRKIMDGKATEEEAQDTTVAVIYAALKRNYPDLTQDFVADEIVDVANSRDLLLLALNASGYVKPGGDASGNAEAGSPQTSVN
jgi:hypothetical protein